MEDKAIAVNTVNGNPFPVTVEFSVTGNVIRVYLTPMSVEEIAVLLPPRTYLLFNIDTNEYDATGSVPLAQVAGDWSSFIRKFNDEILLMSKGQLIDLLEHVGHYNFNLIEVAESINVENVNRVLELTEKKFGASTVIDEIESEFYLNSHDDCYLYFETKDKSLAEQLISLQLKTLAAIVSNRTTTELDFDPNEIMLHDSLSMVIPQEHKVENGRIVWKILEGTFTDFVYERELRDSSLRLVLSGTDLLIENVRTG